MALLSPWFMLLLIPWVVLAIHLFRGARTRQHVPFLNLWRGPVKPKPAAPSVRPPDFPIILALLALLSSIIACAKPALNSSPREQPLAVSRPSPNEIRIDYLAARESPRPQLMIRLSQKVARDRQINLQINSFTRSIDLTQQQQTLFIDLDRLDDVINVSADGSVAGIHRQSAWPRLIVAVDDPHIKKFADIYQRARPASSQSRQIIIGQDILLPPCNNIAKEDRIDVATHPITAHLDWPKVLSTAKITTQSPLQNWRSIITQGGTTLLAESPDDSRKIWLGFSTDPIANTDDFVILWTNIVNYVGHAGESFTTYNRTEESGLRTEKGGPQSSVLSPQSSSSQNPKPYVFSKIFLVIAVALLTLAFLTFSRGRFTVVSSAGIGN